MDQQEIETQLWEYIDNRCSETAKAYIQQMIATDAHWKNLYEQLISLHLSIPAGIGMEQPSMRFTKNVMEAIEHTAITPAIRNYINPAIIRAVAAFFILSIIGSLGYAIATADYSPGSTWIVPDLGNIFNSDFFNILTCINVMIGLLLFDTLLRRKKKKIQQLRQMLL